MSESLRLLTHGGVNVNQRADHAVSCCQGQRGDAVHPVPVHILMVNNHVLCSRLSKLHLPLFLFVLFVPLFPLTLCLSQSLPVSYFHVTYLETSLLTNHIYKLAGLKRFDFTFSYQSWQRSLSEYGGICELLH